MMRRTASEVIRELQIRVARLEKKAYYPEMYESFELCFSGQTIRPHEYHITHRNIMVPRIEVSRNATLKKIREKAVLDGTATITGLTILCPSAPNRANIGGGRDVGRIYLSSMEINTRDLDIALAKSNLSNLNSFDVYRIKSLENIILLTPKVPNTLTIKGVVEVDLHGDRNHEFAFTADLHLLEIVRDTVTMLSEYVTPEDEI